MFCGNCGKELPENAKFCSKCGEPTGAAEEKQQDAGAAALENDEEKVMGGIEKSVQSGKKGKEKKLSKRKLALRAAVLVVVIAVAIPVTIYVCGDGYWLGEYTYDSEGNLLTLTFTDYDRSDGKTTVEEYDREGNIKKRYGYNSKGDIEYEYEWIYSLGIGTAQTASAYKSWAYTDDGIAYLLCERNTVYDSDGNELTYESKYYREDGSICQWEERNSKNGILQSYSEVRYNYDTNEISSERYETYDDFGNTLTYKYVEYDEGNIESHKNYNCSYDEYGHMLEKTVYNSDGTVNYENRYDNEYTFNSDGSVAAVEVYELNDNGVRREHWTEKRIYDYDEEGNVIAKTCIFKDYAEEYSYDSSGNLLAYTKYAAEDYVANDTVLGLEEYTYDDDGNVLTEIYRKNRSDGSEYKGHEYNYYSNGQKSSGISWGESSSPVGDYEEYSYDIYGNYLTAICKEYRDDGSIKWYINYKFSHNSLGICTGYSGSDNFYGEGEENITYKFKYKYTYDKSGNILTAKRKYWVWSDNVILDFRRYI